MKKRREVEEFDRAVAKFLSTKIAEGSTLEQAREMAEGFVAKGTTRFSAAAS